MYLYVGNENAIEAYRNDDDELLFRSLEGRRVTHLVFPDGISVQEAFNTVLGALEYHLEEGAAPVWLESDSKPLMAMLKAHFGMTRTARPKGWGERSGVDEFIEKVQEE